MNSKSYFAINKLCVLCYVQKKEKERKITKGDMGEERERECVERPFNSLTIQWCHEYSLPQQTICFIHT